MLGTLVWDTIRHPGNSGPVESWGGIAYALAALDELLPMDWTIVPIVKIGSDLADEAIAYLGSFGRISDTALVRVVAEPNNRVELVYSDGSKRVEILRGGVPGWTAAEVDAILPGLDALYANFISGRELDLEGAILVRDSLGVPSYADLHSLFLDIETDGRRSPRYLPACEVWAGCFDSVQMNEDEFALFARGDSDPWSVAQGVLDGRSGTIIVTRGAEGADVMTSVGTCGTLVRERMPVERGAVPGDPTGCGDIWGATYFSEVLAGADPRTAVRRAHRVARSKLGSSGAQDFRASLAAGLHVGRRGDTP